MNLPEVVFSSWARWVDRMTVDGIDAPGVYLLAHFPQKPSLGNADPQAQEIIYIGETCDQSLKKRWRQFHRCAFEGKEGHSGGKIYWKIFGKGGENLFVAAFPVDELSDEFRPLFIRYVERKAILDYALKWGAAPKCNKR